MTTALLTALPTILAVKGGIVLLGLAGALKLFILIQVLDKFNNNNNDDDDDDDDYHTGHHGSYGYPHGYNNDYGYIEYGGHGGGYGHGHDQYGSYGYSVPTYGYSHTHHAGYSYGYVPTYGHDHHSGYGHDHHSGYGHDHHKGYGYSAPSYGHGHGHSKGHGHHSTGYGYSAPTYGYGHSKGHHDTHHSTGYGYSTPSYGYGHSKGHHDHHSTGYGYSAPSYGHDHHSSGYGYSAPSHEYGAPVHHRRRRSTKPDVYQYLDDALEADSSQCGLLMVCSLARMPPQERWKEGAELLSVLRNGDSTKSSRGMKMYQSAMRYGEKSRDQKLCERQYSKCRVPVHYMIFIFRSMGRFV